MFYAPYGRSSLRLWQVPLTSPVTTRAWLNQLQRTRPHLAGHLPGLVFIFHLRGLILSRIMAARLRAPIDTILPWCSRVFTGSHNWDSLNDADRNQPDTARFLRPFYWTCFHRPSILRKLVFYFFSNWMVYDRGDSFPVDFEPNGNPFDLIFFRLVIDFRLNEC